MRRRKIVFVDGDEGFLAGIRRMLRPFRGEWEIDFYTWPERALEAMAVDRADVVFSDLRLPGMNGIPFLEEVRRTHPDTVRVVLSGAGDQITRIRSTGVAHQYLAKPCEPGELEWAVRRAAALRSHLNDMQLIETIAGTKSLPSAPTLYHELLEELRTDDPSLARVGAIVAADPAMTAKVLQVVNSAYFGLRRQVSDIRQAVTLLGTDMIMALVLSAHLYSLKSLRGEELEYVEAVWRKSLAVAQLARAIEMIDVSTRVLAEEAYLAGILSGSGKLVFALNWPEEFVQVERSGGGVEQERATFGSDHALAGAYLLSLWGLPDDVVEAVAYHREPSRCAAGASSVLVAVHVASVLEARPDTLTPPEFDMPFLKDAGLRPRIGQWMAVADEITYEREFA